MIRSLIFGLALACSSATQAQLTVTPTPVDPTTVVRKGDVSALQGALATLTARQVVRPTADAIVTDTDGNWAATWATAQTVVPRRVFADAIAADQPYICQAGAVSLTGATGKCWLAGSDNVAAPAGVTVAVIALGQ